MLGRCSSGKACWLRLREGGGSSSIGSGNREPQGFALPTRWVNQAGLDHGVIESLLAQATVRSPSASRNRPEAPDDRCWASSSTVSRRITRPWRSSRRRCCSFISPAISSTLSMAERPRQLSPLPVPHPGFARCGWC